MRTTPLIRHATVICVLTTGASMAVDYIQLNSQPGGAHWNQAYWDGPGVTPAIPTGGNDYFSSAAGPYMDIRTPNVPSIFAGDSLTIGLNSRMIAKNIGSGNLATVNLRLDGGQLFAGNATTNVQYMAGNLEIVSDSAVNLYGDGTVADDRRLTYQSGNLSGSGKLTITGNNAGGNFDDIFQLNNMDATSHTGAIEAINARIPIVGGNAIGDTSRVTLTGAGARLDIRDSETIGGLNGTADSSVIHDTTGYTVTLQPQTNASYAGTVENGFGTLQINALPGVAQEIKSPTLSIRNLVIEGGTLTLDTTTTNITTSTAAQGLFVGKFGNGQLDHNGGTTFITEDMRIAEKSGSQAIVNMNGGSLTVDNIVAGRSGNATSTFNMNGGVINASQGGWATFAGTGTFTQTGGIANFNQFSITHPGFGNTETGTLALNGGIFNTSELITGDGNATMTMNGGTFQAATSFAISTPIAINGPDGGSFDSNGNILTITSPLSGTGPIIKSGLGTVTLNGNNTGHTGPIRISSGTLAVTSLNAIGNTDSVHIDTNSSFDVSAISGGLGYSPAGITFSGNGSIDAGGGTINMAGATVSPGNSPGTFNYDNLALNGFGAYTWEVLDAQGTAGDSLGYDLITVTDSLVAGAPVGTYTVGAGDTVNLLGLAGASGLDISSIGNTTVLDILTAVNGVAGDPKTIGITPGNLARFGDFSLAFSGNILQLTFTSTVPEPSTWATLLILLGGVGFAASRQRKAQRSC